MSLVLSRLAQAVPIVLAPTGMIPTKQMNPAVPLTPAEVAADVKACLDFGITSVHLHARGEDGEPTWERAAFERLVGAVKEVAPDLCINVTTSGRNWSDLERRADALALDGDLKPDLASLTLSSMNFLRSASVNAPDMVASLARIMRERGITPELEIFDIGMVNVASMMAARGQVGPVVVANLFFGNVAGMQATPGEFGLAVDRLPAGTIWSGTGLGDFQFTAQALAIASGGGVRVGLEDGLHLDRERTRLATNPLLVERVHELLALHGRSPLPSARLREMLAANA